MEGLSWETPPLPTKAYVQEPDDGEVDCVLAKGARVELTPSLTRPDEGRVNGMILNIDNWTEPTLATVREVC